jgi:NADPH-dependent glutamate synthase beta subunit-like oxidoreductase/NAD-dependent dihydropyrimidine dehydrogenase PreA subunit
MEELSITIDGKAIKTRSGLSILQAAESAGIYIPSICYHPDLPVDDSCKLCIVEIEGRDDFPLACSTPVAEGMKIKTDSPALRNQRRDALRKLLAKHPCGCLVCWRRERCKPYDICLRNVEVTRRCVLCARNGNCELQKVADYIGLEDKEFDYSYRNLPVYTDNPFFNRDYNLCIGCTRCVRMCKDVKGIGAIKMTGSGDDRIPGPSDDKSLKSSSCHLCCACVEVCPTGALMDKAAEWNPEVKRETITNPCSYACPAGVDAPLYVHLIAEGQYADALGVIREKVPFPATLGRVCIHPCETGCRRNELNKPIAIKFLKRFAAEKGGTQWREMSKKLPATGKKVAIVGSGPAGLTAGYYLAKLGHSVTIFEALPMAGGMMRVGIPRYRLPEDILNSEIDEILRAGIELKLNTRIESLDTLFEQGYNAVFVALGAHRGTNLRIEGENLPGVMDGATFLRKVSLGQKVELGSRVAVIGGGNVAIDSARTALRIGSTDITIVYRRTRAEMPASPEEVEAALEENIKILFLSSPVKISRVNNHLQLTCNKMELGEPDESGRRRPVVVKGGDFNLEFDAIIEAIGQVPDIPSQFGLKTTRNNTIEVDPQTLMTSKPGVFAGGDAVLGPASVIEAIQAGRCAASSIDKYLGGTGDISEKLAKRHQYTEKVPACTVDPGFQDRDQAVMPCLPVEKRCGSFVEVELGFDEKTAVAEAMRCLQCAYRKQIRKAPVPPVQSKKQCEEAEISV